MFLEDGVIKENKFIQKGVFLLTIKSPHIAGSIKPAQFCNVKINDSSFPLLRRPFSVCDVEGDNIIFMIQVHGEGTEILSRKKEGEIINLLGPLGNGFNLTGKYDTAVFVAGGIGAAPFPMMTRLLKGKDIITISAARKSSMVIKYGMENIHVATDDGSEGFHGNAVELFEKLYNENPDRKIKVFACGPTPMLRALGNFAVKHDIDCELSTESAMACGFGICMGCPVESTESEEYKLICKHGPVFKAGEIKL